MAPINRNGKKTKAAAIMSSTQHGVAKRSSDKKTHVFSDMISSLPDCILGCILTLLSVTEAARMTERSKTWQRVFKSPYYKLDNINDADLWRGQCRPRCRSVYLKQSVWRCRAITSLLEERHNSIQRFIIQRTQTSDEMISRWLYMLFQSGVIEELVLEMPLPAYPTRLTHSILNFSSLRSLSLFNCHWPRSNVPAIYSPEWAFPLVTELTLSYMDMTMEAVKDLLTRCPALLSLSLGYPRYTGLLQIQCNNLLSLTKVGLWQYDVRILDAPKLERMLCWPLAPWFTAFDRTITARAPRLHTIGMFRHCPFQDGVVLEQVRTIALFTNVDNLEELNQAIKMLRHLPHLETLHIKMKDGSQSDSSKSKAMSFEELVGSPFACLENSVKTIVLRVNNLVRQKLAFTNYLLGATKSLRSMVIYKKRTAGELLPPERRGSRKAQIIFCDNPNKCTMQFDESASNFKLPDPFML